MNKRWTAKNMPDQSDHVAIVTGANSGIGYETALALACNGATVVLACRNVAKAKQARAHMLDYWPTAQIDLLPLDLSDLAAIHYFGELFRRKYDRLHLLINNAGVMIPPLAMTVDGFELQFGTNHLGHFALTGLLMPTLLQSAAARIVTISSVAHSRGQIDFNNLNAEHAYHRQGAYASSKLANLLFTFELQRRLVQSGSTAVAVAAHPGWAATSQQNYNFTLWFLNKLFGQHPRAGALPALYAATMPAVQGGDYFGPRSWRGLRGYPHKIRAADRAYDTAVAAQLWHVSEALTGIEYKIA